MFDLDEDYDDLLQSGSFLDDDAFRKKLEKARAMTNSAVVAAVKEAEVLIPTVTETDVELVFDPPWNQTMMSEAARLETGML